MKFSLDSYMKGRIRLAERRGLLTGRRMSPAQTFGLELLMIEEAYMEAKLRGDELLNAVKLAIVANVGAEALEGLYPEWFEGEVTEKDLEDLDALEGEFSFEETTTTRDEVEELLATVATMSANSDDVARHRRDGDGPDLDDGGWL